MSRSAGARSPASSCATRRTRCAPAPRTLRPVWGSPRCWPPAAGGTSTWWPPARCPPGWAATTGRRALPLGASPYWSSVRERVAEARAAGAASATAQAGEIAATLGDCLARIEEQHRDTRFQFGRWHGDWVPWNLAWDRERLFAWDWEHSGGDAPLGFDLLHWQFQVAFGQQRRSAAEAASRCAALATPYLERLGIEPADAGALPWMYLLELYLRAQRMQAAGAGWNARFHPAMLQVLRAARA